MRKTCMYCGTTVKESMYCSFCEIELNEEQVMENGKRRKVMFKPFVTINYVKKSTKELKAMSSYELLSLLKLVRAERTISYQYMKDTKDLLSAAREEKNTEAIDLLDPLYLTTVEDYEYMTRKAWVLENLLYERMDEIPTRITEKYLENLYESIKEKFQEYRQKELRDMTFNA